MENVSGGGGVMSKNWLEIVEEKRRKNILRKQHADALKNIYSTEE